MAELVDDTTVCTSVEVGVPPDRAFHLFTAEIGSWWDTDKHILRAPLAEMAFEPFVGGHIVDRGTDGSECRWARVLAYEPPRRVVFSWDIDVRWEIETDPARCSEVEITFEPLAEGSTRRARPPSPRPPWPGLGGHARRRRRRMEPRRLRPLGRPRPGRLAPDGHRRGHAGAAGRGEAVHDRPPVRDREAWPAGRRRDRLGARAGATWRSAKPASSSSCSP